MENIIKLLISGYVVGLACMAYLLLRSCAVQLGVGTGGQVIAIEKAGTTNWFAIALFSMGVSYAWCFLGALIYSIIDSATGFLQF